MHLVFQSEVHHHFNSSVLQERETCREHLLKQFVLHSAFRMRPLVLQNLPFGIAPITYQKGSILIFIVFGDSAEDLP